MNIVSTYRLQFHKGFTFADAIAIVPYLHDLGITHVYASPYLKAVAGSTHGYDVIDHSQINPEIGTFAEYRSFVARLASHGMSHILDTVPNHMGVETNDNRWWNDVLAHGVNSLYADYFDIDFKGFPPRKELQGKVLMPVLGKTLAETLSDEDLKVHGEGEAAYLDYNGRQFPLDSAADLSCDLPNILEQQHYRLAYWRVAADEINYRRFFDITGLAALQMHRQDVFNAVHSFTFELIADRSIAGLRVDHPDGLLDPKQYFERLQAKYAQACPSETSPLYVAVEKILNGDESLRPDWPVAGTSGYDFLCAVNDLFVDCAGEPAMSQVYRKFTCDQTAYADWVYQSKCLVLDQAMHSEMVALTSRLDALAQLEITSRDFTRRQLGEALREMIACFAVYRSYITERGVSESDVRVVEQAVQRAAERNPAIDPATLYFIRDSILLRYPVAPTVRSVQLNFAQRFQQLTSPVNAKGIEDCAFYIYNRLISLNEVGGDAGRFGRPPAEIHSYFSDRQQHWPMALSSTSTHDTKRSEDVRARLNVLSELPAEWADRLDAWRRINADVMREIHPNDQYLLYQTLLGVWPLEEMDDQSRDSVANRVDQYMQKATREAKQRNSWTRPNQAYEKQIQAAIQQLIDPRKCKLFLGDFLQFHNRVSKLGLLNSLSQTVLRLTAPGVADTYQGTELWDFSLVDPDNRRPVDYPALIQMLRELKSNPVDLPTLVKSIEDGRAKLLITQSLLQLRRRHPALFLEGSYEPLELLGPCDQNAFAFGRSHGRAQLIVVVGRLFAALVKDRWIAPDWQDTKLVLPKGASSEWVSVLDQARVRLQTPGEIPMSGILNSLPVNVLWSGPEI